MKTRNFIKSDYSEDEDGWSDNVRDTLEEAFDASEKLAYEVRNCVRGGYTGCNTDEELAEEVRRIGELYIALADNL